MNVKSRNISSLIESQLPQFVVEEYPSFVKFIESYYAQQELSGGVLDIVSNLTKYRDINFYSKDILKESSKTTAITGISDVTISVDNTNGFPEEGLSQADLNKTSEFLRFVQHFPNNPRHEDLQEDLQN